MVFDGEELLEFAIRSIRDHIDFISVTYQETSYFGNKTTGLEELVKDLKDRKLIDQCIFYEPDFFISPKENELKLRNIGLQASREANCTHHISADVDEFYKGTELENAKTLFQDDDYDFSLASLDTYYKDPTFLIYPDQNLFTSFIHPVRNTYNKESAFPKYIEPTRRFTESKKVKIFKKEEIVIHHMSYVRKDITKKFNNSDNKQFYKMEKFMSTYNTYKLGDRVCLIPDFINRKTILVDNTFNIRW